jgi:coproporphyrinogen III oxidase-like Fe-S oxidoreductase
VTTTLPSRAFHEAERVRRAALRALRSGYLFSLTPRRLASLCECEMQVAKNALATLHARRLLAQKGDGYVLTEQGREIEAV